jgi:hypothetical protein
MSEEIVAAMTNATIGDYVDDVDLEEELEQLQQEQLDEQMLTTGNVPVSDAVHKMPTPVNTERKYPERDVGLVIKLTCGSSIEQEAGCGGRRRRGRVAKVAG